MSSASFSTVTVASGSNREFWLATILMRYASGSWGPNVANAAGLIRPLTLTESGLLSMLPCDADDHDIAVRRAGRDKDLGILQI